MHACFFTIYYTYICKRLFSTICSKSFFGQFSLFWQKKQLRDIQRVGVPKIWHKMFFSWFPVTWRKIIRLKVKFIFVFEMPPISSRMMIWCGCFAISQSNNVSFHICFCLWHEDMINPDEWYYTGGIGKWSSWIWLQKFWRSQWKLRNSGPPTNFCCKQQWRQHADFIVSSDTSRSTCSSYVISAFSSNWYYDAASYTDIACYWRCASARQSFAAGFTRPASVGSCASNSNCCFYFSRSTSALFADLCSYAGCDRYFPVLCCSPTTCWLWILLFFLFCSCSFCSLFRTVIVALPIDTYCIATTVQYAVYCVVFI